MKKLTTFTLVLLAYLSVPSIVLARAEWLDASYGYLPSDGIKYTAESLKETISLWTTFDATQKAYRWLDLTKERMAEVEALTTLYHYSFLARTARLYQKQVDKTKAAIDRVPANSSQKSDLEFRLTEALLRHQAVLTNILYSVPKEHQAVIQDLNQFTFNQYQSGIARLTEEQRLAVTQRVLERITDLPDRLPQEVREQVPGLKMPEEPEEDVKVEE